MFSSQVSCSRDARVAVVPVLFPLDVCLVVPIEVYGHHLIDVGRAISMEAGRSPSACNVDVIRKLYPSSVASRITATVSQMRQQSEVPKRVRCRNAAENGWSKEEEEEAAVWTVM